MPTTKVAWLQDEPDRGPRRVSWPRARLPAHALYKDAVQLIAQSGINYTPTLLVSYGAVLRDYFYERFDIHDDAKIRRFIPHEEIDQRAERRDWFRDNQYVSRASRHPAPPFARWRFVGLGCHGSWMARLPLGDVGDGSGGMTPLEDCGLRTWDGGTRSGSNRISVARAGQTGDLIVLDKNPLDDIHNTKHGSLT